MFWLRWMIFEENSPPTYMAYLPSTYSCVYMRQSYSQSSVISLDGYLESFSGQEQGVWNGNGSIRNESVRSSCSRTWEPLNCTSQFPLPSCQGGLTYLFAYNYKVQRMRNLLAKP
ncbi:hypothetical protein WA026_021126 [Henosepilachna vigintioctopunctata]|uniref:Uncharacterized protein n=1 Tax=Henosepilachna vigintioctopunctata TaxID=420089 RepID=A0AAW1U6F9_9CUCU